MKLSTVLLGAGLAVGGYVVYTRFIAKKPASSVPTNPTAPSQSPVSGASSYVNDLGASLLSKLSVALGGSSTWSHKPTTEAREQVAPTKVGVIDLNQSSYSKLAPDRDSLSYVV